MFYNMLLLLTALTYAQFNHAWEVQRDLISDTERETWQLSDEQLKDLVLNCDDKRKHRRPDHVFVRNATLYKMFNKIEVHRVLTSVKETIHYIRNERNVYVTEYRVNNDRNYSINVYDVASVQESIDDYLSATWYTDGELTVIGDMSYWFFLRPLHGQDFSYIGPWGQNLTKSKPVTFGASSGVDTQLKPREQLVVHLMVNRGISKLQIDYEAYLSGNYAAVYEGKQSFVISWGDINSCLGKLNKRTVVRSHVIFKVISYSDARLAVSKKWSLMPAANVHRSIEF